MPFQPGLLWLAAVLTVECLCFTTVIEDNEGRKFKIQSNANGQSLPHLSFRHSETVELELPATKPFLSNTNQEDNETWVQKVIPNINNLKSAEIFLQSLTDQKYTTEGSAEDTKSNTRIWNKPVASVKELMHHRSLRTGLRSTVFGKKSLSGVNTIKQSHCDDDNDENDDEDESNDEESDQCTCMAECAICAAEMNSSKLMNQGTEHTTHAHMTKAPGPKKDEHLKKELWKCEPVYQKNDTLKLSFTWVPIIMWTGQGGKLVWLPIAGGSSLVPDTPEESIQNKKKTQKPNDKRQERPLPHWLQGPPPVNTALNDNKIRSGDQILEKPQLWPQINPYWQSMALHGIPYTWPGSSVPWYGSPRWYDTPSFLPHVHEMKKGPSKASQQWCREHQNEWQVSLQGKDESFSPAGKDLKQQQNKSVAKGEVPLKIEHSEEEIKKEPETVCIKSEAGSEDSLQTKSKLDKGKKYFKNSSHKRRGSGYKIIPNISEQSSSQFQNKTEGIKLVTDENKKVKVKGNQEDSLLEIPLAERDLNQSSEYTITEVTREDVPQYNSNAQTLIQQLQMAISNNDIDYSQDIKPNLTDFARQIVQNPDKYADILLNLQEKNENKFEPAQFSPDSDNSENKTRKNKIKNFPTMNINNIDKSQQSIKSDPVKINPKDATGVSALQQKFWGGPKVKDLHLTSRDENIKKSNVDLYMKKHADDSGGQFHERTDLNPADSEIKQANEIKQDPLSCPSVYNKDEPTQWRDMQVIYRNNANLNLTGDKRAEFTNHRQEPYPIKDSSCEWNWPQGQISLWNPKDILWDTATESEFNWCGNYTESKENCSKCNQSPSDDPKKENEWCNFNPGMLLGPPPYIGNLPILNYEQLSSDNMFKNPQEKIKEPPKVILSKADMTNALEDETVGTGNKRGDNLYDRNQQNLANAYAPALHSDQVVTTLLNPQWDDPKILPSKMGSTKPPWNRKEKERFDLFSSNLRSVSSNTASPQTNSTPMTPTHKPALVNQLDQEYSPESKKLIKAVEKNSNKQIWINNKLIDYSGERSDLKPIDNRKTGMNKAPSLHECQDMLGMGYDSTTATLETVATTVEKKPKGKKRLAKAGKFLYSNKREKENITDLEEKYGEILNRLGISENDIVNSLQPI